MNDLRVCSDVSVATMSCCACVVTNVVCHPQHFVRDASSGNLLRACLALQVIVMVRRM